MVAAWESSIWVVEECKASKDFEVEVAKGLATTYLLGFHGCKSQVTWFFPKANSSHLIIEPRDDDAKEEQGIADDVIVGIEANLKPDSEPAPEPST
ncbi:putative exocyst complex component SEC15B-like [Cocos nucifera]|uniref:Putative exocyst complex component SEC15B-like n=1 Tax=Cocos nucifera TaxID=13894 RepID=A0A8K0ICQ9_COCNU|nr:putative exocyst complex component SEC15B-like [Cocos nucifera]